MAAGPEVARLIEEFQDATELENRSQATKQHDQRASVQTTFLKTVQSVIRMMEETSGIHLKRAAKICWYSTQRRSQHHLELQTPSVVHKVGLVQFDNFVRERLVKRMKATEDAIHRNKLKIFSQHASKPQVKGKQQMQSLKNDMESWTCSRLYGARTGMEN